MKNISPLLFLSSILFACSDPKNSDIDADGVTVADGDCNDLDAGSTTTANDADCDGTITLHDCDDNDADSQTIFTDGDCDGVPPEEDCNDFDASFGSSADDADCDGVSTAEDCDDTNANKGAIASNQDCDDYDAAVDCNDNDPSSMSKDEDGDCDGILTNDDCDDGDATIGSPLTDADCDGYTTENDCNDNDPNSMSRDEDGDCGGTPVDADCDDNNPLSYTVLNDADCDGALTIVDCNDNDALIGSRATDYDCDGYATADDCDDDDDGVGGTDVDGDCDGILTNDDCDDTDPEKGDTTNDFDCDGVATADDCDDSDPNVGDSSLDTDCDGYATTDDCDDSDPSINPAATEICDGIDNNCDDFIGAITSFTWSGIANSASADSSYIGVRFQASSDADILGFSSYISPTSGQDLSWMVYESITQEGSYSLIYSEQTTADTNTTDWYDSPATNITLLNGFYYVFVLEWDGMLTYYSDTLAASSATANWGTLIDGVAVGTSLGSSQTFSTADPYPFTIQSGEEEIDFDVDGVFSCEDCADNDGTTYPNAGFNEINASLCMTDYDGDGYGATNPTASGASAGTDCNDQDASINPSQTELLGDGIDNDCDGVAN